MNCFIHNQAGNATAVLSFKRTQLFYDIQNAAFIEGSVADTDSSHRRHMIQDIGQEGNKDRIARVLEREIARIRETLYPYTKTAISEFSAFDNILREPSVYGIVMTVPDTFSQTSLNYLQQLIHDYLVSKAVADWMSFTNPEKTSVWETKAEESRTEILSCINTRIRHLSRRLSPF